MKKEKVMVVANDLGYGAVKASINEVDNQVILQPSVVAEVQQITSDPIDSSNDNAVKSTIENLFKNMDVTIDKKRYLVGLAASNSTLPRQSFDINSSEGKSRTNLAMLLPLSLIAAKRIQEAYKAEEDIFEPLKVSVVMASALPINEIGFGDTDRRTEYAQRFTSKNHIVIFNNFDNPISVTISFKDVKIFKEGEVATGIAIKHGSSALKKELVQDIKKNYSADTASRAEELINNSQNALGIDIGQGTTDLALTTHGQADVYNSVSIPQGYGTVLRRALKFLPRMEKGYSLPDVVALSYVLNSSPTNRIDEENKETALEAVRTSVPSLISQIEQGVNDALSANHDLEVIYIFGGGSIPLMTQTDLRERLNAILEQKRSKAVIAWAGEKYSQNLNEIGLRLLADEMAQAFN
ncbi:ParM/StbA family protein [uncultured Lactobacillus sp.]|uniref:ParM/StbA family protein n=1 Tax=uncultured Lactobacillus sp. TaxID=153152 RepID=UPI00260BA03E|nr:ParM/StbA family protein [uncultured Lactobacillus sp.]